MEQRRILLKLVLDEIGLSNIVLDTFNKRLRIQKKIYLTQIAGLDLGYRYNWYIRGPYCTSLTESVFLLKDELGSGENDYQQFKLTGTAVGKIDKAKEIWDMSRGVGAKDFEWVELLTSLHYLKNVAYWPPTECTKERVIKKLKDAKPHFANRNDPIEKAWSRLSEHDLLNKKSLS